MSATRIHRATTGISNERTHSSGTDDARTTPVAGGETMSMDTPGQDQDQDQDQDAAAEEPTLEGGYDPETVEKRWQQRWVDEGVYAYESDPEKDPNTVYAIDTPPPTVSGSLHMGHLYGHTLQDFAARFQRMHDGDVLFPFGYDDNGIASERLTEKELDIRHQDYERREFQQLCREVCQEYEAEFTEKMQGLGTSIDWSNTYKTIEPRVQRISQLSFIDLYEQGREYRKKAPAIWCPECETAISQVEMEDMEKGAHFNDIAFELTGDAPRDEFVISTTRPELIPACVSVFVHPDDDENQDLIGETARIPIFGHEVPIIADDRVDMEKGSGVVMCCTFGDQKDIEWYQAHDLPLRVAIDESGTMTDLAGDYEGMSTDEAREAIIEDLDDEGYLRDRESITHTVQVHERCDTPVEFRVSKQWYVEILDHKAEYLEAGREMDWYPEKMFTRYKHWIEGLEWDWLISRQRDSGIPFPVWYCEDCDHEIIAEKEDLPVDPLSDEPPVDTCPECGGDEFVAEDDVFDTWATSSLTPLINAGWDWDEDAEEFTMAKPELYPFDLRPQGHDIISFWLFHTVVKCYEHTGEVPFDATMINGHVLDENREKMSKSRGNVVEPDEVLAEYPVDAVRFWAASAAVGDDFPYQEKDLTAGEKLLRKLWNASKLVDTLAPREPDEPAELEPIDRWLLAELDDAIEELTAQLENYEFAKARDRLRTFFWNTFCDDYLEIAKEREDNPSTQYALRTAHRTFLELWAPFLPHVTEEIWQAVYSDSESRDDNLEETSIHIREWPSPQGYAADLEAGETAMEVISALRRYKSENQLPLNADLESVSVYGPIEGFEDAIQNVMHVQDLTVLEDEPEVTTEVAAIDLDYSTLGPKYGQKVGDIDAGIESGDYEIDDDAGVLRVAGEELDEDVFEVELERSYSGEGEMIETESAVVILE
ncbi:valine--tRNA ligase [Natronolimnohabitans sp. A-GB9]|uniref:valine--tRNA ligase n=1 Tax=Natronolimnohabitans sp. A-GB9 TaxID=3069757 RepID=UPI0027B6401B|nr:valine--tRNA ligase [Natronolimnohabitans sp. A-GB9]MDQ2050461.1 valine--tRNA ligase [Natronolimnohabitans sp. A-GB9]